MLCCCGVMVRTAASGSTRGNHATRNLRPPQPSNSQLDTSDASFGKRRDNNFLERLWRRASITAAVESPLTSKLCIM